MRFNIFLNSTVFVLCNGAKKDKTVMRKPVFQNDNTRRSPIRH